MTAIVQFLNVGWGDAHLIRLPSGKVTLIDGGDGERRQGEDHPLEVLLRGDKLMLDWMILTHIHEDHLNGLLDVARTLKVERAIMPYRLFMLPGTEADYADSSLMVRKVYGMLASYLELIRLLNEQGTELIWRDRFDSAEGVVVWEEEGFVLSHLYPFPHDTQPAHELLIQALQDDPAGGAAFCEALERFFALSNDDSSVYRLTGEGPNGDSVLFGGDQLESGWQRLAARSELRSRFWKVSHHGMEDGFNARILAWIEPEHCIIPISVERSQEMQASWQDLRAHTGTALHMTGEVLNGESRSLSHGHQLKVMIGG